MDLEDLPKAQPAPVLVSFLSSGLHEFEHGITELGWERPSGSSSPSINVLASASVLHGTCSHPAGGSGDLFVNWE